MTDDAEDLEERVLRILFPSYFENRERLKRDGLLLAHYTSAEAALNIIRNRRLWLRQPTTMNDLSEVRHGLEHLGELWNEAPGEAFKAAIEKVQPGAVDAAQEVFNENHRAIYFGSYIGCFSEWRPENSLGRLSMWRAYGGASGVALIFKPSPFFFEDERNGFMTMPVSYAGAEDIGARLLELAERVSAEAEFLRPHVKDSFHNVVFQMLRVLILCSKHPGFAEEQEWRVVHTSGIDEVGGLVEELETIRGIPQWIKKLRLEDFPDEGLVDMDLEKSLHKIVIGPTQFSAPMFTAFHYALRQQGIDPTDKIEMSEIPLRF